MNLDEIRELIRLMKENNISEMDIESEGARVRLKTADSAAPPPMCAPAQCPAPVAPPISAPMSTLSTPSTLPAPPETPPQEDQGIVIKSPIVGMFYRAASPDRPALVEVGDLVEDNSVLCIIEAMKVMNEIKAETRGTLREILAENGRPVEFGQPLFIIEPEA
jgi:acetyl-CoA carboxylase biotin carboxyl carrier protein